MEKDIQFEKFGNYSEKNQDRKLTGFSVHDLDDEIQLTPWNTSYRSPSCGIWIPKEHIYHFLEVIAKKSGLNIQVDSDVIGGFFSWEDTQTRMEELGLSESLTEKDIPLLDRVARKFADSGNGVSWDDLDYWIERAIEFKNSENSKK